MDQVSGEMSVGHSFVFGGDMPAVDESVVGLLGADLVADGRALEDRPDLHLRELEPRSLRRPSTSRA